MIIENKDNETDTVVARNTDLDNYGLPFIRYENGDLLKTTKRKCNCGRELSVIEKIEGRTHDYVTTPSGNLIAGEFFPHLFQSIKGIDQYKILQESINLLIIKIKINENFSQEEIDAYLNKIQAYVGKEMNIILEKVDNFPLEESGKRIFIQSKVKPYFTD